MIRYDFRALGVLFLASVCGEVLAPTLAANPTYSPTIAPASPDA
jgi:hypothetical protein